MDVRVHACTFEGMCRLLQLHLQASLSSIRMQLGRLHMVDQRSLHLCLQLQISHHDDHYGLDQVASVAAPPQIDHREHIVVSS